MSKKKNKPTPPAESESVEVVLEPEPELMPVETPVEPYAKTPVVSIITASIEYIESVIETDNYAAIHGAQYSFISAVQSTLGESLTIADLIVTMNSTAFSPFNVDKAYFEWNDTEAHEAYITLATVINQLRAQNSINADIIFAKFNGMYQSIGQHIVEHISS